MTRRIARASMAVAIAAEALAAATPASAQDARYLAANCANCHGTDGRAVGGLPSLAGLDATYFTEQMKAFRQGKRTATIMHQLSKGYTDEQIAVLAAYFAKQPKQ